MSLSKEIYIAAGFNQEWAEYMEKLPSVNERKEYLDDYQHNEVVISGFIWSLTEEGVQFWDIIQGINYLGVEVVKEFVKEFPTPQLAYMEIGEVLNYLDELHFMAGRS